MGYATPLLNGIRPPDNSFVLPEHKIVYISVTKAACTSIRWMIANLSGEDFENFYYTPVGHQTRLMTVHNRRRWQRTPQLGDLSEDQLAEISRDRGWFIFAVVRDPWSRLWSAWQSKFLVRHTPYVREYYNEPWFPRVPETSQDVVDDFRGFVTARPWETHPVLSTDVHFRPQVVSARPQQINYTRIYDVREMSRLLQDLTTHLAELGLPADLYTPRANETPLGLTAEVLGDEVPEIVADAYRADFEAFGEKWDLSQLKLVEDGWSPDAIRLVQYHTTANQRIGDISTEAKRLRSELYTARKRLRVAQRAERSNNTPTPPEQTNARDRDRTGGQRASRVLRSALPGLDLRVRPRSAVPRFPLRDRLRPEPDTKRPKPLPMLPGRDAVTRSTYASGMKLIGGVNELLQRLVGVRVLRAQRVSALQSRASNARSELRERDAEVERLRARLDGQAMPKQETDKPRPKHEAPKLPEDYEREFSELWELVRGRTMTSHYKAYGLYQAVQYVVRHGIQGAVVECGVWRGGSMLAVARLLASLDAPLRDLYLFDTYEGMTEPTDRDVQISTNRSAQERLATADQGSLVWAIASLEDVQQGFEEISYPIDRVHFVKGPVEETVPGRAPDQIAILRLDTDWYESTRHELKHLYNRLVPGGVLILDDYGHWQGAKDAVDEFMAETGEPLLPLRAGTGRIAVKPGLKTRVDG